MLLAVLVGWFLGFLATLPTQVLQLVRVAEGDERLLLYSLAYGLLVWALATAVIAACALVFVLGPIATFVNPAWLQRHPTATVAALPCLSVAALSYKIGTWYKLQADLDFIRPLFLAYGVFALVFPLVAGLVYMRQLRRGEPEAEV